MIKIKLRSSLNKLIVLSSSGQGRRALDPATQVQILSGLYNHITISFSLCIRLITANPKNKNIIPIIIYGFMVPINIK